MIRENGWSRLARAFTLIEMFVVTGAIGILLGLLLPGLTSAEEKARRRACMDNLKQLGIAIESYTGDYAGYLPSWIGSGTGDWGLGAGSYFQCKERSAGPCGASSPLDPFHAWDAGEPWVFPAQIAYAVYQGRRGVLPNSVGNRRRRFVYDFLSDFRVIAFGSRYAPDGSEYVLSGPGQPPERWNLVDRSGKAAVDYAPHGLGHLLVGGYIGDAGVYYCPSSEDMLPDATAFGGGWSLAHWKAAGGTDAEAMLYSDGWSSNADVSGHASPSNGMIFSNYAYRGVPFWLMRPWCVSMQNSAPCAVLQFTRPAQYTRIGSPLFRTRKELGGRALVSDAFSKACLASEGGDWLDGLNRPYALPTTLEELRERPGMGVAGHRDAYNVLYGDMHAATFADPDETILWHASSDVQNGFSPYSAEVNFGSLGGQHWYPACSPHLDYLTGTMDKESPAWKYSSAKIWHDFDAAAGLDVF